MASKKGLQSTQQVSFKKGEDDEDTLSLDSNRSQEYINEPVNNWPTWTVGNQQQQQSSYANVQHMNPPIFNRALVSFPKPNNEAIQSFQPPVYFSRQPIYSPPQPVYNPLSNQPPSYQHQQQQHFQHQQQYQNFQQPQKKH